MGLSLDLWCSDTVEITRGEGRAVLAFAPSPVAVTAAIRSDGITFRDESGAVVSGEVAVQSGGFLEFDHEDCIGAIDIYSRGHRVRAKFDADLSFVIRTHRG